MRIHDATGPGYAELKPLKPPTRAGRFPVHDDLAERVLAATGITDDTVAHLLGVLAAYSYADTDTVAMLMTRMGLPRSRVRRIGLHVEPMFIVSTAYLVQSEDGRLVLLAYRGTEPTRVVNWLTDLDLYPDRIALRLGEEERVHEVHGGFYRNVRATRFLVVEALRRALDGRPVDGGDDELAGMEALYVTGHSLGGAMASLMGLMVASDPHYASLDAVLRGVLTFGQPMIGGPDLAAACDGDARLRERVVRYVYGRDVVAHLPPRDTGDFAHFGQERRYDGSWPWTVTDDRPAGQVGFVAELVGVPLSFIARQFPPARHLPFRYRLDDHLPHRYVAALTPPGVPNEYGDDLVASVGYEA